MYLKTLADLERVAVPDPLLLRETPESHLIVERGLRFGEGLHM